MEEFGKSGEDLSGNQSTTNPSCAPQSKPNEPQWEPDLNQEAKTSIKQEKNDKQSDEIGRKAKLVEGLKEENSALKSKHDELKTKNDKLEKERSIQSDEIGRKAKRVEKPEKECSELKSKHDELKAKNDKLKNERSIQSDEIGRKAKLVEKLEKECPELKSKHDELKTKNDKLKNEKSIQSDEIGRKAKLVERLEKKCSVLESKHDELKTKNDKLEKERSIQSDEIDRKAKLVVRLEKECSVLESKHDELKTKNTRLEQEKYIQQSEIDRTAKLVANLEKENSALKSERDELKTKFSLVAAAQLQKDNPYVTNLKDPYRGVKLAEMYGKLYNETWTMVFRSIKKQKVESEQNIVERLLDILKRAFDYCNEKRDEQRNAVKHNLLHPFQNDPPRAQVSGQSCADFSEEHNDALRELQRKVALGATEEITKAFIEKEKHAKAAHFAVYEPYIKKCMEFSWPAVLHIPPIMLDVSVQKGDDIDGNLYTMRSNGELVRSLVWPPLLLGKGKENVLHKGVVEGMKTFSKD